MSVNRNKVLEKEIEFFKNQHVRLKKKVNEIEERNRDSMKLLTASKQEVVKFQDKVKLAARPNEILKREKDRYKADCQRLMHLLESSEHRRLARELQKVNAMHYVSLRDCLYVEGVTTEKYASLSDRPSIAALERGNWVPAKALDLVKDFVKDFPDLNLPLQPFTVLILQLNKVWKMKEKSKLKAKSLEIEKKYSKLKRMTENSKPYKLVLCKEKVKHLKRQLGMTNEKFEELERMKNSFKHSNDEHTKLLVQCGVGTIKNLDSQLKGAKHKNRKLSRKLNKISAIAKQQQEQEEEEGGSGGGGGAGRRGRHETMKDLLDEIHDDNDNNFDDEDDGEENLDAMDLINPDRVRTDDEIQSIVYPEDSQADVLEQALERKEQKQEQKKRRARSRTRSRSR